ncbi:MAG TPA: type II toxin-antitoxin system VapC family toxin [Anaerolineae bacterium]|nr:type II toxin-antitoxin system VapC family toxin [Anaerolineae bacterium]HOQ99362.1 type II toxin-antitoxin system VapC family toxin [Anaerolineae bacterium]HPL26799.1 type II toxin-antitoxin system VapC family toxin [Anaerolineae bacterium]
MKAERSFVDTNVFLRYLTNDVPEQAEAVERLLRRAAAGELILTTHSIVIAEIVWTLESYYGLTRDDIKEKVLAILNTPGLEVADGDLVLQAITWYPDKHVDLIDAYCAAWSLAQGVQMVYTFDRKHFSRFDGLAMAVPGQA